MMWLLLLQLVLLVLSVGATDIIVVAVAVAIADTAVVVVAAAEDEAALTLAGDEAQPFPLWFTLPLPEGVVALGNAALKPLNPQI